MSEYEPGESVYSAGDPPGGLIGIRTGQIAVYLAGDNSAPVLAHILRPGYWFGAAAAVMREPRRISAVARSRARVCVLPVRKIDALLADHEQSSAHWRELSRILVDDMDTAFGVARDLMIRNADIRCAALLLRLAGLRYARTYPEGEVEIQVSQADLGHLANMSRNAVGTTLRALRAEGWLDFTYRQVRILKPEALLAHVRRGENL